MLLHLCGRRVDKVKLVEVWTADCRGWPDVHLAAAGM